MIDSIHFFSENNNCTTVNTILVYFLKRTRLSPKWQQLIVTWYGNEKVSSEPEYLPLCEVISFIIIYDGIKDVVVNKKSEL